jgi:hypothetical protein
VVRDDAVAHERVVGDIARRDETCSRRRQQR